MATKIYTEGLRKQMVFPDVTIIPTTNPHAGRFILVQSENKIFSEAANDLGRAIEFMDFLNGIKEKALRDEAYNPDVNDALNFGVPQSAKEAAQRILEKYATVAREKGERFTPGVQFDFSRLTDDGIEVVLGNYGIFFASLIEGAKDTKFKDYLATEGERIFGDRRAFFVNPPATNTALLTKNGYVFVNRGPTAEYPHMFHQAAAGHHFPDKTLKDDSRVVELDELVGYQVATETGIDPAEVSNLRLLGTAFSSGYRIEGTEKAEVLTAVELPFTAEQIWESIQENAAHRWETRSLHLVPPERLASMMSLTIDKNAGLSWPLGVRRFGADSILGADPSATGLWVPVGAATMIMAEESVLKTLPATYQPLNS